MFRTFLVWATTWAAQKGDRIHGEIQAYLLRSGRALVRAPDFDCGSIVLDPAQNKLTIPCDCCLVDNYSLYMRTVHASSPVTLARLQNAYRKVAKLVVSDPAFLPAFARLEDELATFNNRNDVIERAKAVARAQKDIA